MKKELFDEVLESVREGGAILRGEMEPSRRFTFEEPWVVEQHPEAVFEAIGGPLEKAPNPALQGAGAAPRRDSRH